MIPNFRPPKILFLILLILLLPTLKNTPQTSTQTEPISLKQKEQIRQIAVDINNNCTMNNPDCYQQQITNKLLNNYETPQILEALYDFDTYFSCHAFTHFLGRALFYKTQNIPDAYSQINFTCHGGTYHGVIEAYLKNQPSNFDMNGNEIESACQKSSSKTAKNPDQVFTECLHGFGHAFMFITNSDLPISLAYCDKLKLQYQERCYGGAFMENSTSSTNRDHPTKWLSAQDKFFPCTALESHYLDQCYFYQANYLLMITNRDFQKVFADCDELKNSQHNYCVMGIGAQLASVSNERSIEYAASVCQIAKGIAQKLCIEGAVPSLMQRYGGESQNIIEFCNKVAESLKEHCFAKFGNTILAWHSEKQMVNLCTKVQNYKEACLGETNVDLIYN